MWKWPTCWRTLHKVKASGCRKRTSEVEKSQSRHVKRQETYCVVWKLLPFEHDLIWEEFENWTCVTAVSTWWNFSQCAGASSCVSPCIHLNWLCWPSQTGSAGSFLFTRLWGLLAEWEINNVNRRSIRIAKWFEQARVNPLFLYSSLWPVLSAVPHFFGKKDRRQQQRRKVRRPSDNQTGSTSLARLLYDSHSQMLSRSDFFFLH